jgi:sRNA-binding protein
MDKPWTESRGPIVANEFDLKKAKAINAMLTQSIAILPVQAGDPVKPFAVGLWKDIHALLRAGERTTALRRATGSYLHSKRYYFATAQPDSMRHDIDGNPIEAVSASDRIEAQKRFSSLRQSGASEMTHHVGEIAQPEPVLTKAEMIRASLLRRKSSAGGPI